MLYAASEATDQVNLNACWSKSAQLHHNRLVCCWYIKGHKGSQMRRPLCGGKHLTQLWRKMGACLQANNICPSSPLHEKGTCEHLGYGQPDHRKGSLCRPSLLWASWCAALHTYCCALCAAWDPDLHNRWYDPLQAEDSAFGGPITFAKQLSRYA